MPNRGQQLKAEGMQIVADLGKVTPDELMRQLRVHYGASHGEAYKALAELIRDGYVKRTMFGELYLPGRRRTGRNGGSGYPLGIKLVITIGLLGILAFMGWVVYNMLVLRGIL